LLEPSLYHHIIQSIAIFENHEFWLIGIAAFHENACQFLFYAKMRSAYLSAQGVHSVNYAFESGWMADAQEMIPSAARPLVSISRLLCISANSSRT